MEAVKMHDLIDQFSRIAREAHRRGDINGRNQAEENIREVAPVALAAKIIADLYTECTHNWLGGYCDLCGAVKPV